MRLRSILLALLLATPAVADDTARLAPVATGAAEKVGGSLYGNPTLSDAKPAAIVKLPAGPSAHPLYGTLPIRTPGDGLGKALAKALADKPAGR